MLETFLEERLAVEVEVNVPPGFRSKRRMVPALGYPAELFGISDQDLPDTTVDDVPDMFPRAGLLDRGSVLIWVTVGDHAFDRDAPELTGPKGSKTPAEIRSRKPERIDKVHELSSRDQGHEGGSMFPGVYMWARTLPLTDRHYVNLYCFAGGGHDYERNNQPPAEMSRIVGTMKLRDYS